VPVEALRYILINETIGSQQVTYGDE